MIQLNNVSLLVGLRNNAEYSINFYLTTRNLYPDVEICFVSYGSTDRTHQWLEDTLELDDNLRIFYSKEDKTFSDTFNKAAEISTKEYCIFLHNDIILGENFIENIAKHLNKNSVVSYTTIEPPIFAGHERPGKIIHDLGIDFVNFKSKEFNSLVESNQKLHKNELSPGITFFMAFHKETYLEMGGMDNLFSPMFCEDDDLIRRFKLKGLETNTSLDAICYHFVSKTSRFSEEYKTKTQKIELNSNRNFLRKWGTKNLSIGKYDIGIEVKNANKNLIQALEPFCNTLYVDCDFEEYIKEEQPNTKFKLDKRIKPIEAPKENVIVVKFDGQLLNNEKYQVIQQLPEIINNTAGWGIYSYDIFRIEIGSLNSLKEELINLNSSTYINNF